jgi:hypothetical protein
MLISFSLFPHAEATFSRRQSATLEWSAFVKGLSEWEFVEKKTDIQLLLPVSFKSEATSRKKSEVDEIFLATLDVDGASFEEAEALEEFLRENDYKAFIYTTWRNLDSAQGLDKKGNEVPPSLRFRVLLPLSRPVKAHEWEYFWDAYNNHFHGLADAACKDPSRGYFVPALPVELCQKPLESLAENKQAYFREIPGKNEIDVDWLLAGYVSSGQIASSRNAPTPKGVRVDREQLEQFARTLRRRKREDLQELGHKMLKGLRGEVFESPGSRDTTVFKMAKEIAIRFPDGDAGRIADLFEAALLAMEEEEPGSPTAENFKEKLERAQAEELAAREASKREKAKKAQQEESKVSRLEESNELVTEDVLREHLRETGQTIDHDEFKLILSFQGSYYFFTTSGYVGPFKMVDFMPACRRYLEEKARPVGFRMEYVTQTDEGLPRVRPKTREDLMKDYGTVVKEIRYNYGGKSYLDYAEDVLHVSYISESPIKATFVLEVDAWIEKAFGEDADVIRDWLSQVPNLNRSLAALCMVGPPDVGKSAFATGVARIWKTTPVPMSVAMGDFNADLLRTPVVLADEDLPRDFKGRVRTEALRSIISSGTHSVNRKGLPRVDLDGHLRCMVAINNIEKFSFGNAKHSDNDVEAIQKRFVIADMRDRSASELFNYKRFVEENGIAKHTLWLSENRQRKDDRFGVVTNSRSYVALADHAASQIVDELLDRLVMNPLISEESRKYRSNFSSPILLAPGRNVLVSVDLLDSLKMNDKAWKDVSKRSFSNSLSAISKSSVIVKLAEDYNRRRFHLIDNKVLFMHHCRCNGTMPWDEFARYLSLYHDAEYYGTQFAPTAEHSREREDALKHFNRLRNVIYLTDRKKEA